MARAIFEEARSMSAVVLLVGAGASFDAGMPLVAQLTGELRHRLPDVHDINGRSRPEFPLLFETIAQHDEEVAKNYERFFEWLALMRQGQREPFCKLVSWLRPPGIRRRRDRGRAGGAWRGTAARSKALTF
jgi:hypothetical protein